MTREEIRNKLLSLFSANFNDGENIEERVGSKDMYSVSSIVEFIDDYVVPYIAEKVLEEKIGENNMWIAQYRGASKRLTSDGYTANTIDVVANSFESRINDLQAELSKLKEEE